MAFRGRRPNTRWNSRTSAGTTSVPTLTASTSARSITPPPSGPTRAILGGSPPRPNQNMELLEALQQVLKEPGEPGMSSFNMENFLFSGDLRQIEFLMLNPQVMKPREAKSSWSEYFCRFLKTVLRISGVVLQNKLERKTESDRSNVGSVAGEEPASQTKDHKSEGTLTPEELDVLAIESLYRMIDEWECRKLLYHFDDTHSHTGKIDLKNGKPILSHIKSDVSKMTEKLLGDDKNRSAESSAPSILGDDKNRSAESSAPTILGDDKNRSAESSAPLLLGDDKNGSAESSAPTLLGDDKNGSAEASVPTLLGDDKNESAEASARTLLGDDKNRSAESSAPTILGDDKKGSAESSAPTLLVDDKNGSTESSAPTLLGDDKNGSAESSAPTLLGDDKNESAESSAPTLLGDDKYGSAEASAPTLLGDDKNRSAESSAPTLLGDDKNRSAEALHQHFWVTTRIDQQNPHEHFWVTTGVDQQNPRHKHLLKMWKKRSRTNLQS